MEDFMKRKELFMVIVFVVTGLFAVSLLAQDVVQQVGTAGSVDWTAQKIKATGYGAPPPNLPSAAQRAAAIEAAKVVALRNLLATIKGMALNSETTVENYMVTSDVIRTKVEGVVRGFTVVDIRYMSTGDVEVDVEMPISGALSDILLPQQFGGGQLMAVAQPLCPTCGQPWPAGKPVPPGVKLIMPPGTAQPGGAEAPSAAYTGLVIDARGLQLRPAMSPKVLNEAGKEVYGSMYVSRDYAVQIGVVGYAKSLEQARTNERVTDNPLVVKALKVVGPNRCDVVISNSDAQMIHTAASTMNFLDHCRVILVVD
ncbi:hypothetical protein DRQ15_08895 [candidate division KSB1 bacterium]|nr:MAG: hypothetical protein DRQ12_11980 [candidate division KSB1 bacterium]RKY85273.1 MAG: hypothetical protein DRP98_03235 [candidate division KSB1 bacterium]RKY89595.1 MAG: hypothetical protein DRQ15_08895 [candidate division KSB1 bacterium]